MRTPSRSTPGAGAVDSLLVMAGVSGIDFPVIVEVPTMKRSSKIIQLQQSGCQLRVPVLILTLHLNLAVRPWRIAKRGRDSGRRKHSR